MKITIINGTNRINNKSINISKSIFHICLSHNFETSLITLENFTTFFNGEFINKDNADPEQLKDITAIQDCNILIYVVPTYHSGIPSPLKNLLDILHSKDIYNNK